jgi:hypothetical protein
MPSRRGYSGSTDAASVPPPRKRAPAKLAAPKPPEELRRAAIDEAVEAAFEHWRNTPGRAAYVRNALVQAAEAAYDAAVDARGDG